MVLNKTTTLFIVINLLMIVFSIVYFSITSRTTAKRPHIVVILADDLGFSDLSFRGSDLIPTPNIDALAYTGRILNYHYTLPTCTPSRSALLTGLHPSLLGMQGPPMLCGQRGGVPLKHKLLPQTLQEMGYRTHMVGKWHIGYETDQHLPVNRGFDSFFGYYNGYMDYYMHNVNQTLDENSIYRGYDLHNNTDPQWQLQGQYATDLFTKETVRIIHNHATDAPLFLYFSHLAVHIGTEATGEDGLQSPPDVDPDITFSHIINPYRRKYASLVQSLDASVGTVVKALSDRNMLEDSVLLFLADNGGSSASVNGTMLPNYASNWPLRGLKGTLYEGGVRGAGLVWNPSRIPGGIVDNQLYHISDWADILPALAGRPSKNNITNELLNQLFSNTSSPTPRDMFLNIDEKQNTEAVILDSRFKLVKQNIGNSANFDHHYYLQPNGPNVPVVTTDMVFQSTVGKILKDEGVNLSENSIHTLRKLAHVPCEPRFPKQPGFVPASKEFFCRDYCLFDLVKDPCEYAPVHDVDLVKRGKKILNRFRRNLVPQSHRRADASSNPNRFGGVWSPWLL